MLAREAVIVALDFETTGQVRGQLNVPWQIGAAAVACGRLLAEPPLSLFLRVPMEYHFNPYAPGRWAEIRGTLAESNSLVEEWPRVSPWLVGHCLMAHHAPTERGILRQAFPMHELGPWVDTLNMARAAYPSLTDYSLSALLTILNLKERVEAVCPGLAPHDACYDAVGCAVLFEHLVSLPGWSDVSLEYLISL